MNNNMLEFIVKMKDLMSSGLTKLSQTAKKVFGNVQTDVDKTIVKNKELANSFDLIDKKATSSSGGISRFLGSLKGLGIAGAITGLISTAALSGFIKDSVGKSIQFEKTNKSFEVLTGNAGIGRSMANQLNKLQQDTILGPEVFKNAQTLLAFGLGAEKVLPSLEMLGNVSMGDAEKMERLTLAFAQTQSAGKLTGQDLLQYVNAGFNPLNEIAKQTGKSVGDLRKEMEKGNITSAMVTSAFQAATGKGGLFNNMLDKMAETTGGRMAQLQGTFEALKISVGNHFKPVVNDAVNSLTKLVGIVKKWFDVPVATEVNEQIQKIHELQLRIQSLSTTESERLDLLKELEQINPNLTKGINAQNIEYGKLQQNILGVVAALNKKKLADRIETENSNIIYDYNEAQQKIVQSRSGLIADIVKAAPELLNRTDLTFGQQQIEAQRILREKISSGKVTPYHYTSTGSMGQSVSTDGTLEEDLLNSIKGWIEYNNKAVSVSNKLQPKFQKVQNDIKTATDAYNKVFGLDEMVASNIKGGKPAVAGSENDGKSLAQGITGGGPRVININGVTMKVAENMTVNATDGKDFLNKMEPHLQNFLLRLLNSGASVQ